jgi:DNA invertase Pin-like site-specific DNA recombinase
VRKATLVIAKLDRLARDAHFLLGLQRSGIAFTAADMPNANRLTVGIMAMVAEEERRAISDRTKAALAAAKARGVRLGGRVENLKNAALGRQRANETRRVRAASRAADLAPLIETIRAAGATSATAIAKALNDRGIPTARGGRWQAVQVQRLLRATADATL